MNCNIEQLSMYDDKDKEWLSVRITSYHIFYINNKIAKEHAVKNEIMQAACKNVKENIHDCGDDMKLIVRSRLLHASAPGLVCSSPM
jgi:hypothetical protein